MPARIAFLIFAFFALFLTGAGRCSEQTTTPAKMCEARSQRACTCHGESWGIQYCNHDGTEWGQCSCLGELSMR